MTTLALDIDPLTRPPDVDMVLPGSKSITNRALVAAALAKGCSTLSNVLIAEDTLAMIDCLRAFGIAIDVEVAARRATVIGGGPVAPAGDLWVRQSGTTARFVLPLASLCSGNVVVDGAEQIRGRPQHDLLRALGHIGVVVEPLGAAGHLPVRVTGSAAVGGTVSVPGDVSSQFVSGLLLSAPAMPDGLVLELTGDVVSKPYIDLTVAIMAKFGANVEVSDNRYVVASTGYKACDLEIEPDASTASYFFAAAAVAGGRVGVLGLGSESLQGDAAFVDVLEAMGAQVSRSAGRTEVRGPDMLSGIEVSMSDISDTAPTLAAIAPFASGTVRATGIGFIRHKESDRIGDVVAELRNVGADAEEDSDGFVVRPKAPHAGTVDSHDDHRLAMAFTVLGLVTPGVSVRDPYCVSKTFPEFYDAVDHLRSAGDAELAVLALDGPAGSGKSTVAKAVAARLGLEYLDTGAMYRGVTWAALAAQIELGDDMRVADLARRVELDIGVDVVLVDGADATDGIRERDVDANVSQVAANSGVRAAMRRQQRAWARRRGGGVLEGRDIGSVVFPSARLKVYVTASLEERARRRAAQSGVPHDELLHTMQERDRLDSSRSDSPLTESLDAVVVDTTDMSIDDVVDHIAELFDAG